MATTKPDLYQSDADAREDGEDHLMRVRAALSRMVGIFDLVLEDCWDDHDLTAFRSDATEVAKSLCTLEDVIARGVRAKERAA